MKNYGQADMITVWGSPGSGKSVFSGLLAAMLEHRKKKVIVVSPNIQTPMLPVFFPRESVENRYSLGHIFEQPDYSAADLARHIFHTKAHPDIGVLAYAPGDTAMRYPDTTKKQAETLIDGVSRIADTVILDCSSDMREVFPYVAMAAADRTVCILSADLRGIAYLSAQKPLLSAPQFRLEEHRIILGTKKNYQSADGFPDRSLSFPWKRELETAFGEGTLFDALPHCTKTHLAVLEAVVSQKKGEDDHDEAERNTGGTGGNL